MKLCVVQLKANVMSLSSQMQQTILMRLEFS